MRVDRLNRIEQYIIDHETVSLNKLCEVFDISLNTVRRDINELLARGAIRKVYGGVMAVDKARPVPALIRNDMNTDGKAVIGELAAMLIRDNDLVFIDSGSTTPYVIRHLAEKKNVTIISHSLAVLNEASHYSSLKLVAIGGEYNGKTDSFVGMSSIDTINNLIIRAALMAATGVSIENGMSNTTYYEAEIKRAVVKRSKSTVLMADYTKFDHDALLSFCRLEDVECVVSDRRVSQKYLQFFEREGVRFLCSDSD